MGKQTQQHRQTAYQSIKKQDQLNNINKQRTSSTNNNTK